MVGLQHVRKTAYDSLSEVREPGRPRHRRVREMPREGPLPMSDLRGRGGPRFEELRTMRSEAQRFLEVPGALTGNRADWGFNIPHRIPG